MTEGRSPYKSRGMARLRSALRNSLRGLQVAWRHEAAFRQELLLLIVMAPLAFWLGGSPLEIILLLGTLVMVLVVELLNSALECVSDAVTLEEHPFIGRAKDLGSAAVLLTLTMTAAIWITLIVVRLQGALR